MSFQADTGLNGSVVGRLYAGGGSAVSPPRTFIPEGPATITGAAYGGSGGGGSSSCGTHGLIAGLVAGLLLIGIWVTLPR